ncbi:MAG: hypothetical protein QOJ81_1506, partial [Chloroflexota bacterium]|nr:hypothetical protein [Chloroflexota bacterium]
MTPQRRGILVTLAAFGLTFLVGLGFVLAAGMSASPTSGPRDDGNGNPTLVSVSGDLDDGPTGAWNAAKAYWDLPGDHLTPFPIYEIATQGSTAVTTDGVFNFKVEVPWYDNEANPVRPGKHFISVCATRPSSTSGTASCVVHVFAVVKGTANLSKASGRQGSPLSISGKGWVPEPVDEAIRITWAPAGANIDMIGDVFGPSTWTRTFNVPNLPAGNYPIRICNVSNFDGSCSESVVKQFTITSPIFTLSKASGPTGSPFDYSGDTFFPGRPVKIWFGPAGEVPGDPLVHEIGPGGASTNADGHFGKFTYAPTEGPGDYTVTVCTLSARGPCNSFDIAQKPYTVTAPATPSPTPKPTASPTNSPSPTPKPTASPTPAPTASPAPTATPSSAPTISPSPMPTASPTATASPTLTPTPTPSLAPTVAPVSAPPTAAPTATPDETPEPTVAPTAEATAPPPSPTPAAVISWPEHLHSPGQTSGGGGLDLGTLGGMSLLALLIAFLVPFPGTLFNKTVEANYAEIMGWVGGARQRWNSFLDKLAIGPLRPVRRW